MKKLLTGTLALLLLVGAAQAQTKDSSKRGQHKKEWAQKLNISEAQQKQLQTIREARMEEMKALKAQNLTGEELKPKRKEIGKKYAGQTSAVFTPEQKEEMKKIRSERKGKFKNKDKKGRGHGKNFARKGGMAKELNFTDAQKEEMKKMREEGRSQFQAVKNDTRLSETEKKARMQEIRKAQAEKMKSILTPEQAEKMESFKNKRRPGKK